MLDDYDVKQHLDLVSSWSADPTAYLSRYYTLHYHIDPTQADQALYVRQAPNKVCILGIVQNHPALQQQQQETPIEFIPKLATGDNVKPDVVLCELVVGETRYAIRSHMRGKLLEFNPRLTSALLRAKPMTEGYLAVILPFHENPAIQLKEYVEEQIYNEKQQQPSEMTSEAINGGDETPIDADTS